MNDVNSARKYDASTSNERCIVDQDVPNGERIAHLLKGAYFSPLGPCLSHVIRFSCATAPHAPLIVIVIASYSAPCSYRPTVLSMRQGTLGGAQPFVLSDDTPFRMPVPSTESSDHSKSRSTPR